LEERLKMADNMVRPRFKRKQFIVARKFQLKYAGVILLLMFITAGFCSYAIYYTTMIRFGAKLANVYPQGQLVAIVNTVNFRILVSIMVISPLVGFLGIYLSHKIAGPVYRIEKSLGSMAAGDLSFRITLRKGDEMVSLANNINRLTDSLVMAIKTEKAHLENASKELYALRELISSAAPQEKALMNNSLENLDNEIRLIGKELDKYKV
jgi:methyl-accepting chemotaxis protein